MNQRISLLISLALIAVDPLFADEQRRVTLVDRVPFAGEVERVLMLALNEAASPELVEASWIATDQQGELSCVGRVKLPEATERLRVLSVILGVDGEVRSAYREFISDELPPAAQLSLQGLRDRFVERRGVYRNLQSEAEAQDHRLRVLQRDADNIAMVSRIISAEDELSEVKAKLDRVVAAEKAIDRRSEQIKTRPQPLNAQKREAELVVHLNNLTAAIK
jgi:hypothetical protein